MANEKFYIDMFDLGGSLKKIWYYYLIIGILLAITGLIGIVNPLGFSISLIYVLSWSFLLMGLLNIYYAYQGRKNKYFHWGIVLVSGIIDILAAVSIFYTPFDSAVILLIDLRILMLFSGCSLIFTSGKAVADDIPEVHSIRSILIVRGILDIIFGILLVICPLLMGYILPVIIGFYLLFMGILFIIYSIQVKRA